MTSRARRKSFVVDEEEEVGKGPWTDEEKRRFLEGLAKHGKDFRLLTAEIGTREIEQVRRYYSYHKAKMDPNNQQTPSSSRKRKNATEEEGTTFATMGTVNRKKTKKTATAGGDTFASVALAKMQEEGTTFATMATVNRKKTKKTATAGGDTFASVALAKMQAGPGVKTVATHHPTAVSIPITTAKKRSSSKAAAKLSPAQDILPPTKVIYHPAKPKAKPRNIVKPEKVVPKVVNSSSNHVMNETKPSPASLKKERLLQLLKREEVQSVLSGVFGFLAVIAFKKFVG